ncbi:endonuclease/exonuclease/phosphatase family protein [Neptunitalea lumnitzerae]|nr:endonuclease/exonuclease/phosphatase family protein [Neptunitalea sp. Y10]
MKKIFLIAGLFVVFQTSFSQEINIMTYNIRYGNETDDENSWSFRKEALVNLINYYSPDVMGTQEGLQYQLEYIAKNSSYKYIGVGRDNGKKEGEYSAIFYNSKKFKVLKSATFWLSPTPDVPSKGWDAALNRVCTYGLFENKETKSRFYVFNAHFDHVGVQARAEAAKLMLLKLKELNTDNLPAFVTGDFNLTPASEPIQIFSQQLNDSYTHSTTKPYGPAGTWNAYHFSENPVNRIDYIFTSGNLKVLKYRTITDFYDFKYPSDHLPVLITALQE